MNITFDDFKKQSHEYQEGKVCSTCKEHKPLSEYTKRPKSKDGLRYECRSCVKKYTDSKCRFNVWYFTKKKDGKRAGFEWDIEPEDIPGVRIRETIKEARNRKYYSWEAVEYPKVCPILGLELDWGMNGRQLNSPSLDRIDSTKGYIRGNVMMISDLANKMKQNATPEQLRKFSRYHLFGRNKCT